MLRLFLVVLFTSSIFTVSAQKKYSIKSKRAIKQYEMAGKYYQNGEKEKVIEYLKNAIKIEPKFVEAYLFMADFYHRNKNNVAEIRALEKAVAIDASFFSGTYLNLAEAYRKQGEYQQAKEAVVNFMLLKKKSVRNKKRAEKELQKCNFALQLKANPVDFNPISLGENINTTADEYWVTPTADESELIFTRLVMPKRQEDFYIASKKGNVWSKAKRLSTIINTSENEGAQSITADGKMMYFTACGRADSYGRCDIYYTQRVNDEWSKPVNIGAPVNSGAWEAQPSISADGRTLYFVSNRKSGKGKMDIYKSDLIEVLPNGKQRWSKPENLSFNTPNNEMSPYIHASGTYLIFASDGLPGMGNFDLYKTTKNKKGAWQTPKNMGYPINTFGNEISLAINAMGDKAYFSSDRDSTMGKDIYTFKMPISLRPPKVTWIKGIVQDSISKNPLKAELQLINLNVNDTVYQLESATDGTFLMCLPMGENYGLAVEKSGYCFYSNNFDTSNGSSKGEPLSLELNLLPIQNNRSVVLNNLFFKVDSWDIDSKSENELDRLFRFLQKNKNIKIEIAGHTDNSGSEKHNKILSENRAKAVCNYLHAKGIKVERMTFVGYGSSCPIADNNKLEGKAKNRRTTFKILKVK